MQKQEETQRAAFLYYKPFFKGCLYLFERQSDWERKCFQLLLTPKMSTTAMAGTGGRLASWTSPAQVARNQVVGPFSWVSQMDQQKAHHSSRQLNQCSEYQKLSKLNSKGYVILTCKAMALILIVFKRMKWWVWYSLILACGAGTTRHIHTSSRPGCFICLWPRKAEDAQSLGPLHSCGRCGKGSWLPALVLPSSVCYNHLRSETADKVLPLSLSLSLCNSLQ